MTNTPNKRPEGTIKTLQEMTPEEAAPIMEAWRTGEPLEYYSLAGEAWFEKNKRVLIGDHAYRIPVTYPTVDWDRVPPRVNYIAANENGAVLAYDRKPTLYHRHFGGTLKTWYLNSIGRFAINYNRGTCDWQDSLIMRPSAEHEENE